MDNDFVDHGTDVSDAITIRIYKDSWIASKPWHADLVFADGHVWKGWQQFFHTKKALVKNAKAAADTAQVEYVLV